MSTSRLFVLGLVLAMLNTGSPAMEEQQAPQTDSDQTRSDNVTAPATTPVNQPSATPDPTENNSRTNEGINWSNWALCFVGVVGIIVAVCTLKTIQKQTEATARSAAATEESVIRAEREFRSVHQQWLDLGNWSVRLRRGNDGNERLDLTLELRNPTNMAITMKKVNADIVSINPFVLLPREDPAPQITTLIDTRTNEFIDTGIAPQEHHIRIPVSRNPDPRVERYSGDPERPFQTKGSDAPPTGGSKSNLPAKRRGETILQGHVMAPDRSDFLSAGWYDLDTPDKVALYNSGGLRFHVNVTIEYTDAFSQPRTQSFVSLAAMGRHAGHVIENAAVGMDHMPGRDIFGKKVQDEDQDRKQP